MKSSLFKKLSIFSFAAVALATPILTTSCSSNSSASYYSGNSGSDSANDSTNSTTDEYSESWASSMSGYGNNIALTQTQINARQDRTKSILSLFNEIKNSNDKYIINRYSTVFEVNYERATKPETYVSLINYENQTLESKFKFAFAQYTNKDMEYLYVSKQDFINKYRSTFDTYNPYHYTDVNKDYLLFLHVNQGLNQYGWKIMHYFYLKRTKEFYPNSNVTIPSVLPEIDEYYYKYIFEGNLKDELELYQEIYDYIKA